MTLLCIVPGPDKVLAQREDTEFRWCFKCRHRHTHMWELLGDSTPSYYEPVWVLRCPCCKNDYTRFPGT